MRYLQNQREVDAKTQVRLPSVIIRSCPRMVDVMLSVPIIDGLFVSPVNGRASITHCFRPVHDFV